jgi:hypothetical protein
MRGDSTWVALNAQASRTTIRNRTLQVIAPDAR